MALKIYSYDNNPRVDKCLVAAKYAGITIEKAAFKWPEDLQSEHLAKLNPLKKVPVLETPEGAIFESNAILRYVGRHSTTLYGANNFEHALVDQWIDFSANELATPLGVWMFPIFGWFPFNHEATEKAKVDVTKSLNVLNNHLTAHTYLVGESVTLADIACAFALIRAYKILFDAKFRKPFQAVNRWFTTLIRQPNWRDIVGKFELCKEMQVAKPTEKAPEAAKPAAAKPAAKPADDGEDDGEEKTETKKVNPLDLLPPSRMNLDDWKRYYSNAEDTRGDAMKWFFEKIDDGWSVWFSDYKYNTELEKMLLVSNLVGGYIQRLDRLRKYGFASLAIFGEEGSGIQIAGVFLVRGQEMPAELKEVDDAELYDWKKADLTSDADKELISDFFCWDGKFAGKYKPFNTGKIFK